MKSTAFVTAIFLCFQLYFVHYFLLIVNCNLLFVFPVPDPARPRKVLAYPLFRNTAFVYVFPFIFR